MDDFKVIGTKAESRGKRDYRREMRLLRSVAICVIFFHVFFVVLVLVLSWCCPGRRGRSCWRCSRWCCCCPCCSYCRFWPSPFFRFTSKLLLFPVLLLSAPCPSVCSTDGVAPKYTLPRFPLNFSARLRFRPHPPRCRPVLAKSTASQVCGSQIFGTNSGTLAGEQPGCNRGYPPSPPFPT